MIPSAALSASNYARDTIARGHVRDKQNFQRLHGGNDVPKARRFLHEGGNQALLLDDNAESQARQLTRERQDCPRDKGNVKCGQGLDRGR